MRRSATEVLRRGFDSTLANWPLILIRIAEGIVFVGIVIAFGLPTPAADPRQLLGDLMLLGGGAAWAGLSKKL